MMSASIQTAQRVIQEIIQSLLNISRITEHLNACLSEFLLRAHTHASGDDVSHLILQYLIHRDTAASAMNRGIRHDPAADDLFLILIDIRKKKILTLPKMRAYIAMNTVLILQNNSDSHVHNLPFFYITRIVTPAPVYPLCRSYGHNCQTRAYPFALSSNLAFL